MSHHEHKSHAPARVSVALLTISDSRTSATDTGGALMRAKVEGAGHVVVAHEIVPDEPARVCAALRAFVDAGAECILTTGGTGITRRDATYEAIAGLLEKRLDGFGELFRMLSYEQIGAAAMLSRAVAGVYRDAVVFSMPGSPDAVTLALDRLVLPELGHAVFLAKRDVHRGEGGGVKR